MAPDGSRQICGAIRWPHRLRTTSGKIQTVDQAYADLRTALSTRVFAQRPDAPGTCDCRANGIERSSRAVQSSWVIVSGGNSLMVWLPWPGKLGQDLVVETAEP